MKKAFIVLLAMAGVVVACNKNNNAGNGYTADCTTPKTWSADASPVIMNTCATGSGCHGAGSHQGPGALTNYSQVYSNIGAVRNAVASGRMPPGGMSASQENALLCWIDNGAPNN